MNTEFLQYDLDGLILLCWHFDTNNSLTIYVILTYTQSTLGFNLTLNKIMHNTNTNYTKEQ
jgi:hypothetical protein